LGGKNASPCHLDIPLHGYSLYLDDRQIIERGDVLVPEMRPRS
jgi:2,5-dihydroxypyridine 5,6-dioxygenase